MKAGQIFVAGKWQATRSGETHRPINPANEESIGAVGKGDERGRIVWRPGNLIRQHLDETARLESLCPDKTMFDSGKVEIPFAAAVFRYHAGLATKIAAAGWTRDVSKALKAARAIRAGTVWVNAYNLFDAALPFGGFKESGFGREMGSVGLDNYTEVKTVWVDLS